jgi:hypothetical protein
MATVVTTLAAMASGKFAPVLSLMVGLIVAGSRGIAPPDIGFCSEQRWVIAMVAVEWLKRERFVE